MAADQRVNCVVYDVPSGGKHLVFEIAGTKQCVGEMRLLGLDERYLLAIAQMFSTYATQRRGKRPIPAHVQKIINGSH